MLVFLLYERNNIDACVVFLGLIHLKFGHCSITDLLVVDWHRWDTDTQTLGSNGSRAGLPSRSTQSHRPGVQDCGDQLCTTDDQHRQGRLNFFYRLSLIYVP